MTTIEVTSKSQQTLDKIEKWLNGDGDVATYSSGQLAHWAKRHLKDEAGHQCTECGWCEPNLTLGRTILTIDHVDGNWLNNKYDNLKVLCFNCHTLTQTYGALNVGNSPRSRPGLPQKQREGYYIREVKTQLDKECGDSTCSNIIAIRSTHCRKHAPVYSVRKTKIDWPSDEDLVDAVKRSNFYALGKVLGVSDNSIRKRLKSRGYDIKTLTKTQQEEK